jgi:hypothetical protein
MEELHQTIMKEQVARLTKLPTPGLGPVNLPANTVRIFDERGIELNHHDVKIKGFMPRQHHRLQNRHHNKAK